MSPSEHPRLGLAGAVGLWSLAVAQPTISLLGANPSLFTFHDVSGTSAWLLVLMVALAPAALAWLAVEALERVSPRPVPPWVLSLILVSCGGAALAVEWAKAIAGAGLIALLAGLTGALALPLVWTASGSARHWLSLLAVLPAVSIVAFVMSPSGELLRASAGSSDETLTPGDHPPVVMIVLDEFPTQSILAPDGSIDDVRFPRLAEFGETATWYTNATTLSASTASALPSMLTGQDPRLDEPLWTNYPDNLFTLFEDTHRLAVFEAVTELCRSPRCGEIPGGGRAVDPRPRQLLDELAAFVGDRLGPLTEETVQFDQFEERPGGEAVPGWNPDLSRPERMAAFTDQLVAHDEPVLWFLHLVLPHPPWNTYSGGGAYNYTGIPEMPEPIGTSRGEWPAALSEQRHLLQAQHTDTLIGETLDAVADAGFFEEALIIVTADHGATFQLDRPFRNLEPGMFNDVAFVPLFVKLPGQTSGGADDANVMHVDLVPTIAEVSGIEVPWDVDGVPIGSPAMVDRGTTKRGMDAPVVNADLERNVRGWVEFDMVEEAPSAEDRWIRAIGDGEDPLAGLNEAAGILDLVGTSPTPTEDTRPALVPLTDYFADHRGAGLGPPGILQGLVASPPPSAEAVLFTLDGVVTTGAPLVELEEFEDTFAILMPEGSWTSEEEIGLLLLHDDGMTDPIAWEDW